MEYEIFFERVQLLLLIMQIMINLYF